MNILVAINKQYVNQLIKLLRSIEITHKNQVINVYVINRALEKLDYEKILEHFIDNINIKINFIKIDSKEINNMPVYEKRYPVEIYYRLFAVKYLPKNINRILYLDVDTIVINSLNELYNMDFENNLFIGASHIKEKLHKLNVSRFGVNENYVYVNTGVLMMNLKELRKISIEDEVLYFLKRNKNKLILPDQDIIFALYGNKIKTVESLKYNLGDREIKVHNLYNEEKINLNWVKKNTVIIHYYGRNKPWNKNYNGILNYFYNEIL